MNGPVARELPDGFRIRLGQECARRGRHLIGGSPLRVLTLSHAAAAMIDAGGVLRVTDDGARQVARRLLDAGVADPVPPEAGPAADEAVTVVIPVRGNQSGVDRLLRALPGLPVIVVDDASPEPITVPDSPLIRVVRLERNEGPAAARNHGAALADTEVVAFLDSDTVPCSGWLRDAAWHFADPTVALVAPRIVGLSRPGRYAPIAVYANRHSSLDMGPRPAAAAPGRPLSYVPSAALLARRAALDAVGGFDAALRVAEDVDLCWRLAAAGWTVRYEPDSRVAHEHRSDLRELLGRRRFYGTGAAELARRHGGAAAPVVATPIGIAATVGLLSRTRAGTVLALGVYLWMFSRLRTALRSVPGGDGLAARNVACAAWFGTLQGWSSMLRHHWPITLVAALAVPRFRRRLLAAAVAEAAATWVAQVIAEPGARHPDPLSWAVLHRLDDLAYGLGVWQGVAARRDLAALRPVVTRR
ncbi:mycofactocin biosynthesis glycosyltransferase MftF [Tsukamurella spumae]|uniref:Mycofactocin system glycosyltransferase n=1 Tax=Tsukamurella spumae TaxID=44753 RepID=A0A846X3N5_9ACTN|nr:mycofactocin biosynthesis glycosyltransferase MftF [Tsukamurella spumae]NKY20118.1 mycofactocin system glycosyltransferase [Tsukamurella spumae]